MTANELFGRLTDREAGELFGWFFENDRPGYRSCVGLLATRRKLRPVYIERKPKDERHQWMKESLAKPSNADLAAEILQAWILGPHAGMVLEFLDELKIPHDGKGIIDSLPPEPAGDAVRLAVENLFSKHPATVVFVYLHLFSGMDLASGWPVLKDIVATDPRLCNAQPISA